MREIMKIRKKYKTKFDNVYYKENGSGFRYRFKVKRKEYSGICLNCKTEEEAYQYTQTIKNEIYDRERGIIVCKDREYTLGKAAKAYLKYMSEKSTYKDAKRHIETFLEHFGEDKLVMSLDHEQAREYRKHIRNSQIVTIGGNIIRKEKDNKTINNYIASVKSMLNLCYKNNKISRNPLEKLEDLPIKGSRKRVLFDDEQQRLFQVIKEKGFKDLGDTIITRLCTAMRQGEVFNLAWENINLENRIMKIYRQKTKNWTTLYILDPLYKILLERQGNNSKWVFPNPKTGKPYTKMDKAFKTCRELAQIKEYIKQHDFRRTAATWMYEEGIDIYTISVILGHTNIKTTRIYIGIKQKTINDAVNKHSV